MKLNPCVFNGISALSSPQGGLLIRITFLLVF